jgi:hypothetical protein
MPDEDTKKRNKPRQLVSRESRRQWTDEEALRFIELFKTDAPAQYEEYVRQELKNEGIEFDLWIAMRRIGERIAPGVDFREIDKLLLKARGRVRSTLGLAWE